MSRIGKQPIAVPDGVDISIEPELVSVKGPKGELAERKSREIDVTQENGEIVVTRPTDRGDCVAGHVVDELRADAAVRAEHGQPRPLCGAAHLRAHPTAAAQPRLWLRLDGHARLPTFRWTYSPS